MAPSSKCANFRLVIGSLPVSLFFWKSHRIWQPLKDLIRELTQGIEGHPEPLHCDVNPLNRLALCPYVEKKHAWEAFDLLQGFEWSLEGHTSILKVWLIEWDSQGHPHKLAGPGNDNNSVTPVFAPSTTAPAYSPRSPRTVAKSPWPPAWSSDSGTLQMDKRPLAQGGVRYPPASSMMQSQDASSAYPAVSSYATLTRPQICNPGHYSSAATPSNSRCFDSTGSYLEQRLGQTAFGQPLTPSRTVSSASSISSVCTTFASSIAPGVGEARVPGPPSRCSGNSTSSSGASTPGPYHIASGQSDTSSTVGGVRIHGRSSIASDDSAFTSMLGDLSNFGPSSGPSSILSSPTMFRHSSQLSSASQHAQGTHELLVHPIPPGTTKETFNAEVLEATFGRYTPHAGIRIMDTDEQMQVYVTYHDEEQAKQAAEKLEKVYYKGRKLQACVKEGIEGEIRI